MVFLHWCRSLMFWINSVDGIPPLMFCINSIDGRIPWWYSCTDVDVWCSGIILLMVFLHWCRSLMYGINSIDGIHALISIPDVLDYCYWCILIYFLLTPQGRGCRKEGDRQKQRERKTDRLTDKERQTDRETQRKRDKQTETGEGSNLTTNIRTPIDHRIIKITKVNAPNVKLP